jgi:hypothetical protein
MEPQAIEEYSPDRTAVIPARYVISQMLRDADRINRSEDGKNDWIIRYGKAARTKKVDIDAVVNDVMNGPLRKVIISPRIEQGKKQLKKTVQITYGRLMSDEFVMYDNEKGWTSSTRGFVLRRELMEIRKDHLEKQSSLTGLIVTKHALERLYEREECTHQNIENRVKRDISYVSKALAFAIKARLCSGGDPYKKGAMFLLPVSDGLMIVRNEVVMIEQNVNPETRETVAKNNKILILPLTKRTERTINVEPIEGMDLQGYVMSMAMTYVSSDMLSFEQKSYISMFLEEMKKHNLEDLSRELYSVRCMHETAREDVEIEVKPILHYLLGIVTRHKKQGPLCLSIGWEGRKDKRSKSKSGKIETSDYSMNGMRRAEAR